MLASCIVSVSRFARIKIGQQLLNLDRVDRAGGWLSRFETVIERDRHQEEVVLGHVQLEPTGREQEVVAKRSRADLLNTAPDVRVFVNQVSRVVTISTSASRFS